MKSNLSPSVLNAPSHPLTPAQVARREGILAATLQKIAEKGYDAVTMNELAVAGEVSKRTLYDIYGSKEALLAAAVADRMVSILAGIEDAATGRGLSRMFHTVKVTIDAVLEFPRLSRALEPILFLDPGRFTIREFFDKLHRRCLADMAEDGFLEDWADPDFLVANLMTEQIAVQNFWAADIIGTEELEPFALISACRILLPVARGEAREEIATKIRELQTVLGSWSYLRRRRDARRT